MSEFDNSLTNDIRKWSTIDKDAAELIHATVT